MKFKKIIRIILNRKTWKLHAMKTYTRPNGSSVRLNWRQKIKIQAALAKENWTFKECDVYMKDDGTIAFILGSVTDAQNKELWYLSDHTYVKKH